MQMMEVCLTKFTYQVALSIVILNLILQTQRIGSEALELYNIAARMTNIDRIPAIGIVTKVIGITLPTTMVRNEIVDTIGINVEAMIIVHRGDKQNLQWL